MSLQTGFQTKSYWILQHMATASLKATFFEKTIYNQIGRDKHLKITSVLLWSIIYLNTSCIVHNLVYNK